MLTRSTENSSFLLHGKLTLNQTLSHIFFVYINHVDLTVVLDDTYVLYITLILQMEKLRPVADA